MANVLNSKLKCQAEKVSQLWFRSFQKMNRKIKEKRVSFSHYLVLGIAVMLIDRSQEPVPFTKQPEIDMVTSSKLQGQSMKRFELTAYCLMKEQENQDRRNLFRILRERIRHRRTRRRRHGTRKDRCWGRRHSSAASRRLKIWQRRRHFPPSFSLSPCPVNNPEENLYHSPSFNLLQRPSIFKSELVSP